MELQNYFMINAYALMILLLIYLKIRQYSDKYLKEQRLFLQLVFFNAILLILDLAMWIVEGSTWSWTHNIYLFILTVYYILNPVPCMFWSLYADYQVNHSTKRLRKIVKPLLIPVFVNLLLSLANIKGGFLFYVDNNNLLQRGPLFIIVFIICYLYFAYTFWQIRAQRDKMSESEFNALFFFPFFPFVGGILTYILNDVTVVWVTMTFSLLIIFISILSQQLYLDHLTGLFNRRQLDTFLNDRLKERGPDKIIGGIMMDLNSFKKINDIYGHGVGDQALEAVAGVLKKSLRKDDFISRYGGDEFTVIIEIHKENDLINAVSRIQENLDQFNLGQTLPFDLSLSFGYDIYGPDSGMTGQQFLKHIDDLMYEDKDKNKYKIADP